MGQRGEMVLPAGLSPASPTFEASRFKTLSYGSIKIGLPALARILGQNSPPSQEATEGTLRSDLTPGRVQSEGWSRQELALPRGISARQFMKLLLLLLNHAGVKWWVATVLPRALRFKRPLHHLSTDSDKRCYAKVEVINRCESPRSDGGVRTRSTLR